MLYITLGYDENVDIEVIHDVSGCFDDEYEKEWLNNQLAKDIIKGIDLSDHIKDHLIESPVLGVISPRDLSSGCKGTLLLLNLPDIIVCGERFGDNCFEWLSKVGEVRNIHITLAHMLGIELNGVPIHAVVTNYNREVRTGFELISMEHVYLSNTKPEDVENKMKIFREAHYGL